ncbi:hypothetical protein [Histidinibacterium lentulum]|uniref:hypothetical protein n=1 Tax=Histidinibacterium lentulum TaxID=2480588 RepID=UPI000F4D0ECD|nr:hypothetical protein [Histidinibacterium lentulum]
MTRARTKLTSGATLCSAALFLSGCGGVPLPLAGGGGLDIEDPGPPVLDAAAQGYATPDPAYTPPGSPGAIGCTTIVNSVSTGPIYTATRWGLSEWEDFTRTNDQVSLPGPGDDALIAGYIVDFCQGTPVGDVRDAVNVFLSARPGSNASQFGGVDPPLDVPAADGPDSILTGEIGTET